MIPYLQKEGIKKIDKLIITHGDADHIGSCATVIIKYNRKRSCIWPKGTRCGIRKIVKKQALEKKVKIREVREGESWSINGAEFFVLAPTGKESSENNASIVMLAKLGGLTWLFTGDLEEEGEKFLVATYPELRADVLKVAHHGSNTSSTTPFLSVVQPNIAVISVGERNRYGHPHKDVIERFEKRGIEIWRTDKQGAISYVFKGKTEPFVAKSHMMKHIIDKKTASKQQSLRTDKFNNSCNDEKCYEKTK